ncbi:hypothetical protein HanIR_Chr17g0871041 [Helianthus annuus]|nr:hypothetical protein HanIR_Chr17g0871041 [Helianthus annuus]
MEYVNRKTNFIESVDIDQLEMDVLEEILKQIGYDCDMIFYFHFKEAYLFLDFGLRMLSNDNDLEAMFDNVRNRVRLIDIYVEHWKSTVMLHSIDDDSGPTRDIVPYRNAIEKAKFIESQNDLSLMLETETAIKNTSEKNLKMKVIKKAVMEDRVSILIQIILIMIMLRKIICWWIFM